VPYQLHCSPLANEELLEMEELTDEIEEEDLLDEVIIEDELDLMLELELTGTLEELLLMLDELLLLLDELELLPKLVASLEVALIPFALLIRKSPQVLRLDGSKLIAISNAVQQLPLPLQLQPM
jgi:hypothetical protein